MSGTAAIFVTSPIQHSARRRRRSGHGGGNGIFFLTLHSFRMDLSRTCLFFRDPSSSSSSHSHHGFSKRISISTSPKPFSPVMVWQDCKTKMEIDVPISVAYNCYSDREAIPRWMPFISSVKILEDKPDLSQWSLKYEAFGRDIEFSWLARNMQPIPNQKIHWRSLDGLPNRGAVRFFPKGPSSCVVELTVSYEVPQILVPVASIWSGFRIWIRSIDNHRLVTTKMDTIELNLQPCCWSPNFEFNSLQVFPAIKELCNVHSRHLLYAWTS